MVLIEDSITNDLHQKCLNELNEKADQNCWRSSTINWSSEVKQGVIGSCISTPVSDKIQKLLEKELESSLPKHRKLICKYYIWQPNSGIAIHDDEHHIFGATFYLNQDWHPNAGGWFIWADQGTERSGIYKAILPEFNSMVVNDNSEPHLVTSVSPDTPDFRYTIQIWGD